MCYNSNDVLLLNVLLLFLQVSKFLDSAGSKVDYRRYGETLFDILFAGGILGECVCVCKGEWYYGDGSE